MNKLPKINHGKKCSYGACEKKAHSRGLCSYHYRVETQKGGGSKEERDLKKEQETKAIKEKRKLDLIGKLSSEDLEKMFLTPCKTRAELMNFVKFFFNLHLPDMNVSRYTDTNPFDALWELYQVSVLGKNIGSNNIIYCASRGSGKTLIVAIAQLLSVIHGKRDVVHVGAILSQAERCYQYVQGFLLGEKVKPIVSPAGLGEDFRILRKDTMQKSVINTGGRNNTIEILPCTLKAVNGPHVSLVTVDEIDTLATGEQMRAYKDISGMLDSRDGKKAIRVDISTRKSRHGLMNQLMENAEKQGKLLRRWTVFEFMERCPDSRSGLMKQNYFIDQTKFDVRLPADFIKLPDTQKKEYLEHEAYVGCQKCPLLPICNGDAKKQISKSPMLKTVQEVADKVLAEGPDWALSQLMNLKPSVEGVVFKEFDERQHICSWNQMWVRLTGTDFPGTCDHDTFVKKCLSMGLQSYAGEDWGWSNPSTIVIFFIDKKENVFVVKCDGQTQVSNPTWIHHIKTKFQNKYKISLHFPDSADPGNLQEMAKAGLAASDKAGKSKIETGIQVIKKWLRAPGSNSPKIFLAEETCKPLIREFQVFHYKTSADGEVGDDLDKGDDHWLDALRYAMEGIFGKAQSILSSESMESMDMSTIMNAKGEYLRPPTPEEWSKANGITLNPTADQDKLGKIGRLSELEGSGDDNDEFGGAFTWSF
jgi:hypothetical protein